MFLLSAVLLLGMQTIPEYAVVEVRERGKGCEYRAEGRRITQAQLEHRAKVWARQGRDGEVQSDRDISFNCVGQAIAIMQAAGMEKVAYVGKPIGRSVLVSVQAQGCLPTVNGDAMTMAQFGVEARRWRRDKPEIHFQPDPNASYDCVDAVLKIVQENSSTKLGFVGNEQYGAQ